MLTFTDEDNSNRSKYRSVLPSDDGYDKPYS